MSDLWNVVALWNTSYFVPEAQEAKIDSEKINSKANFLKKNGFKSKKNVWVNKK